MKKIFKEFKEFAMRGNVMDMAIGIIIGAAFGAVVSSFVADVLMPPIGLLIGGVDFAKLAVILKHATESAPAVTMNYGMFIQAVVDFIIVAFAIFMMVRLINSHRRKEEAKAAAAAPAVPEPTKEETLLTEIRDLLKKNAGVK